MSDHDIDRSKYLLDIARRLRDGHLSRPLAEAALLVGGFTDELVARVLADSDPKPEPFNINRRVWFVLSEHGANIMNRSIGLDVDDAKAGEMINKHLWRVMEIFGPATSWGAAPCFDGNKIWFEDPEAPAKETPTEEPGPMSERAEGYWWVKWNGQRRPEHLWRVLYVTADSGWDKDKWQWGPYLGKCPDTMLAQAEGRIETLGMEVKLRGDELDAERVYSKGQFKRGHDAGVFAATPTREPVGPIDSPEALVARIDKDIYEPGYPRAMLIQDIEKLRAENAALRASTAEPDPTPPDLVHMIRDRQPVRMFGRPFVLTHAVLDDVEPGHPASVFVAPVQPASVTLKALELRLAHPVVPQPKAEPERPLASLFTNALMLLQRCADSEDGYVAVDVLEEGCLTVMQNDDLVKGGRPIWHCTDYGRRHLGQGEGR